MYEYCTHRLVTERLALRPAVPADATVYRRLWEERDPRVPSHRRISSDGRPTVEEIAVGLRPGLLTVETTHGGEVIGYCGLIDDPASPYRPELAFELLRAAHGRGYAAVGAGAVVDRAREAGRTRLWATVWEWNVASRRVLEKLGFRETDEADTSRDGALSLVTMLEL